MTNSIAFLTVMLSLCVAVGCAKKATPEEARKACSKWSAFQQAMAAQERSQDPVETVVTEFRGRLQDLKTRQAQAIDAFRKECLAQAEKAKPHERAETADACYLAMNRKALEFAPEFQELNRQKVDALKTALDDKERAQEAAKVQMADDVDTCTQQSLHERVTRAKVACQLAAPTMEDFQKCRKVD